MGRASSTVVTTLSSLTLFLLLFLVTAPLAAAAQGDCGQPVSTGSGPSAADCLYILQASVGTRTCTPECICDISGSGDIAATDALLCLQAAVGSPVELACPCGGTTTTVGGTASVSVDASVEGDAVPGAAVTAVAAITTTGGCTVSKIAWTQSAGAPATINMADTANATVILGSVSDYKDTLLSVIAEPPITEAQLPPNVPLPEGEFPGGLQSRFYLVGLNPFSLEEAGLVTLEVEVSSSCGTVTGSVDVNTTIPWKTAPGIRNVPIGRPVLLHGRNHTDENMDGVDDVTGADATTYDWALATKPFNSAAALIDATTQSPEFTPDKTGVYMVTVTDTTRLPGTDVISLEIHAGTWEGAITGQNGNGRPVAQDCQTCHNGVTAPDTFSTWRNTGHAEIFTDNLNTSTHYGESCFPCHTVGYDTDVVNGGFDDAPDYDLFLNSGLLNNPSPDNWTTMLATYDQSARLANIQCENCHGPQRGGAAHGTGEPRISLSADVCGICHGEPLRHARYQQWQLSGHANYEVAVDEGTSGNCSRCHTVNGFLTWLPILIDDDPATDPTADIQVAWTEDEVHPQTCQACHDPHDIGTVSGEPTNAKVRIAGSTPPLIAGFTARGVGKGAICMTCHNSRRGLRNDRTFPEFAGTSEAARAPHGSAQTDMLMGENAYLVNVGIRGEHSFVENTCVNCHMEQTDPPDLLSYSLGGTNHTFYASDDICSNCHGQAFNAAGVQEAFQATLDDLKFVLEQAILQLMADEIDAGNVIVLDVGADDETIIFDIAEILGIDFVGESHGRQAVVVTLSDMTTMGPLRMSDIEVHDGIMTAECPMSLTRCELYDFANDVIPKAAWNWNLVNNDGSLGIHNPRFALTVMDASIDALLDVLP